jgi:hypothetical protein
MTRSHCPPHTHATDETVAEQFPTCPMATTRATNLNAHRCEVQVAPGYPLRWLLAILSGGSWLSSRVAPGCALGRLLVCSRVAQ